MPKGVYQGPRAGNGGAKKLDGFVRYDNGRIKYRFVDGEYIPIRESDEPKGERYGSRGKESLPEAVGKDGGGV
jgi:hypothetical protein